MHRRAFSAAVLVAVTLGAAGCGGARPSSKASPGVPTSGTIAHGTVPLPPTAAPSSGGSSAKASSAGATTGRSASSAVSVPGAGTYTLALAAAGGRGPCPEPGLGGSDFAFRVSISNPTAASEPLARVGVAVSGTSGGRAVAAISYLGLCINFTEPGGTLGPRQTVTYSGTASGVTARNVLTADVISTPSNNDLGSVSLAVGKP